MIRSRLITVIATFLASGLCLGQALLFVDEKLIESLSARCGTTFSSECSPNEISVGHIGQTDRDGYEVLSEVDNFMQFTGGIETFADDIGHTYRVENYADINDAYNRLYYSPCLDYSLGWSFCFF